MRRGSAGAGDERRGRWTIPLRVRGADAAQQEEAPLGQLGDGEPTSSSLVSLLFGSLGKCGQGAGRQEACDRSADTLKLYMGRAPTGAVSTRLPFGWAGQISASAGFALVGPGLPSLLAWVHLLVVASLSTSLRKQPSWFSILGLLG